MSNSTASAGVARPVGSCFSPLDEHLKLSQEGYSPRAIELVVRQGGNRSSFKEASEDLQVLARLEVSPTHVQRLTERVGQEWAQARDAEIGAFREQRLQPTTALAPKVAAVMLDGGRLQVRAAAAGRGVSEPGWQETKVACCLSLSSSEKAIDPQPQPPPALLEPLRVMRLAAELKGHASAGKAKARPADGKATRPKPRRRPKRRRRRRKQQQVRTVLASMADSDTFGWQVSAEVHKRRLGEASRKACVCDGLKWNWSIFAMHLLPLGFIGILDFLHLVAYLYAAAQAAGGDGDAAWRLYEQWLHWAWAGKVGLLLGALQAAASRLGPPPPQAKEDDPRQLLADAVSYVTNNKDKMKYPEYRRLGLPISSAPVESVVKQLNRRVKGTEKFWLREKVEGVLQVRAAYLSEDGRAERYWARPRPRGRAVGRGRLSRSE